MYRFSFFAVTKLTILLFCIVVTQILALSAKSQMRQVYLDNTQDDNPIVKMSFYSPSDGYVAFGDWIGYTIDSGRTFTQKYITSSNVNYGTYNPNLTFGFFINGVKAFDQNTILVYGHYGLVPSILRSTDGGNSFTLVFHSQFNSVLAGINDMVFPQNGQTGFAVDPNRILKTINGGVTWTINRNSASYAFTNTVVGLTGNIVAIFGRDDPNLSNPIMISNSTLTSWVTTNGPEGAMLRCCFFLTQFTGFINVFQNNQNIIYRTTSGGITWTRISNPDVAQFTFLKMFFIDNNVGYALGEQYRVYKTVTGGATWEPLPRDSSFTYLNFLHNDFHFLNANQFWAGGEHSLLELTTNGGGTPLPTAFFKIDTVGLVSSIGNVNLLNFSNPAYQCEWYVNGVYIGNSYNASYNHIFTRDRDTIKLVVTNGQHTDSTKKIALFTIPPLPTVTSFTPTSGSTGTLVTINGINFNGVTNLSFGGMPASSYTVVSPTLIYATVGNGATGNLALTSTYGTFSYPTFNYFSPPTAPPPIINSFSPTSGVIGTTVTIDGLNFNTDVTGNIVYFGATRATVSSASSTQLVCTVPAGASYLPLSVLNNSNGLTGFSSKPFNVVFADSSDFTEGSFISVLNYGYPALRIPQSIDAADIDGDGKPDVVGSIYLSGDAIDIYRNTSTGGSFSFAPVVQISDVELGGSSGRSALRDLDGDGKADIASSTNQGYINVYRNTSTSGNISFMPFLQLPTGQGSQDIAAGDLDNDGRADLAVACYNSSRVSIIRNTSSPGYLSFGINTNYLAGGNVINVAIGDLDGDGWKDVVTHNGGNFSYFKNQSTTGNILLSSKTDIAIPGGGGNIHVVDFDGDYKLDVITLNNNGYSVFRNISAGGIIAFAPVINYFLFAPTRGSSVSNLSGDAKPDLLAGHASSNKFTPIKNTSLAGNVNIGVVVGVPSPIPTHTNVADFNLDGKPDVVISSSSNKVISILKNNMRPTINASLCSGGSTSFTSDLNVMGCCHRWEVDDGSGFVEINGNGYYSGELTSVLTLNSIPSSWYGYRYRCLVNGNYTNYYTIKFEARWVGAVSNEWSNPLNWHCGVVPDGNTDVIIYSGSVVVSSNASCRTLTLSPGVSLTVTNGSTLTVTH